MTPPTFLTRRLLVFGAVMGAFALAACGGVEGEQGGSDSADAVATDEASLSLEAGAEWDFFARLNAERRAHGRPELQMSPGLQNIARRWSEHLARTRTLSHNPDFAPQITREVTRSWTWTAENVGRGWNVLQIHDAFVNSPPHHANMLSQANYVGIGVFQEAGELFVTVNLMRSGPVPAISPPACCAVSGAIAVKYAALGGARSALGAPLTDELATPDGRGRFNHFQGGSIYWTEQTGAFEVRGAIHGSWARSGWERGVLGYPVTDELGTPDGTGRFNHFQGGSIYWTPATGARMVRGAIREAWRQQGWEQGSLGYPTSDEYAVTGGQRSDFQGGALIWTASTGRVRRVPR